MGGSVSGYGSAGVPLRQSATLERADLFAIPTFYTDLQLDNQSMIDALYDIKNKDPKGLHRSNTIGWHSPDDLNHRAEFLQLVKPVEAIANGLVNSQEYSHLFKQNDNNITVNIGNMWGMISCQYAYNVTHTHPGCSISGVYYLSVPSDSGSIEFQHPSEAAEFFQYGLAKETFVTHRGRLILFPPWLRHSVHQNMSDQDRICISFNLNFHWD
jgi:uncharacterized protein (TIGR02466 family)